MIRVWAENLDSCEKPSSPKFYGIKMNIAVGMGAGGVVIVS